MNASPGSIEEYTMAQCLYEECDEMPVRLARMIEDGERKTMTLVEAAASYYAWRVSGIDLCHEMLHDNKVMS